VDELERLAALQSGASNGVPPPLEDVEPRTLAEVIETHRRWLYLPDPGSVCVVLGTVAANRLPGDPVWTLLVGPPGAGKSEPLQAISGLRDVYPAGTLTERALLSGTPKREQGKGSKGGLLREVDDFGILACKDFGSVLNIRREERAALLAALREIYDGSWTRHIGADGGRTLHWRGKLGLVGGATPAIDAHHGVMGVMGERFCFYRLPPASPVEQSRRSLAQCGHEPEMRDELARAAAGLFVTELDPPRERSDEETERLIALAGYMARARSAVMRDGYTRDIELVPGAEAPTRLVKMLDRLLAGLDVIGCERRHAWEIVTKVARDSAPALRMVLDTLVATGEPMKTSAVAEVVRHPTGTTRRTLEDLTAHHVVLRHAGGQGKADTWELSGFAREHYIAAFPERSEPGAYSSHIYPNLAEEDISEKVGNRPNSALNLGI
jgi:hypothetical protein